MPAASGYAAARNTGAAHTATRGMTDCAVLLEAAYEDTVEKLLALKETLEG